ncbi:MAG TPA: ABC transporter substrate-binding protein, partial [Anaerolineae bacterium]|nr:ABC transporter substrate-binding protein [Anaerolineae bacterium]
IRIFNFGTEFADTVIYKPSFELIPQRLEPIDTIDCIYLSALYDDAIKIASQINEYNIKTVLLGDSGWNSENVSEELGKYFEGSYLVSSVPEQADSLGSMYFTDDFNARIRELRSMTSRKGYDTCAVLINCLAQGARDPEKLVGNLESLRDFKGLSSRFTIDPEKHINTAVDFVHIQNGKYVKVDYVKKM